jgi:DHA2 family methylenomycin A resistance protein-like MFS transporter
MQSFLQVDASARAAPAFAFVVVSTSVSFFVTQLDVTIVNVALPRIAVDLSASLGALQWVVDAYTLALAVTMLSAGALGDRLGARRGFRLGIALFGAASLGCALAPSALALNLSRALQGVGAAAMLPNSLALLSQSFSHDPGRRARAVGWWTASGAIALALGPVVGGLLVAALGWRWIFFVNVPVCALGFALAARLPGGGTGQRIEGFDAADQLRAPNPLLPSSLLSQPAFLPAVGYGMVMNFTYYGSIFVLSIFLQQALGYSPLRAGLAFLPLTAGFFASNVISGRMVARFGSCLPMLIGACVDAIGFALLLTVNSRSTYSQLALGFLLIPMGMGLGVPAMTAAVLSCSEKRLSATASAVLNTARQASGAVGVAILGAWAHGGPDNIAHAIRDAAGLCIVMLSVAFAFSLRVNPLTGGCEGKQTRLP